MLDQVDTLATAHELEDEILPLRPVHGSTPALAIAPFIIDPLDSARMCKVMRNLYKDEADRIHGRNMNPFMMKATEEGLSDAFRVSLEAANNGLKNFSFHFIKTVLTKMARSESLDYLFEQNLRKWTQSSMIMKIFARRAPATSRFVRLVTKFVCKSIEKQINWFEQEMKLENSPFPFLDTSLFCNIVPDAHQ